MLTVIRQQEITSPEAPLFFFTPDHGKSWSLVGRDGLSPIKRSHISAKPIRESESNDVIRLKDLLCSDERLRQTASEESHVVPLLAESKQEAEMTVDLPPALVAPTSAASARCSSAMSASSARYASAAQAECLGERSSLLLPAHTASEPGHCMFASGMRNVSPHGAGAPDAVSLVSRSSGRRAGRVLAAAAPPSTATSLDAPPGPASPSRSPPCEDTAPCDKADSVTDKGRGEDQVQDACRSGVEGARRWLARVLVGIVVGVLAVLASGMLPTLGGRSGESGGVQQHSDVPAAWRRILRGGAAAQGRGGQGGRKDAARRSIFNILFPLVGRNAGGCSGSDHGEDARRCVGSGTPCAAAQGGVTVARYVKELEAAGALERLLQDKIARRNSVR